MTLLDKPGVYDIPEADYHADPCPEPSLSSSILKTLLDRTPRHAWLAHPRLNPNHQPENKRAFDIGTAAHAWLLQGENQVVQIDAPDYRTVAAREARDKAYVAGRVPLLTKEMEEVFRMVAAARPQLLHHTDAPDAFQKGEPERTLVWQEDGLWFRIRADWLATDGRCVIDDYKTTADASPDVWAKRVLFEKGGDLQAAFYMRGAQAVLGWPSCRFRFVVQETKPPYALIVVELGPRALEWAEKRVEEGIRRWRWCLENNRWPGFVGRTFHAEPPTYKEYQWQDEFDRYAIAKEEGGDLLVEAMEWQAPLEGDAA